MKISDNKNLEYRADESEMEKLIDNAKKHNQLIFELINDLKDDATIAIQIEKIFILYAELTIMLGKINHMIERNKNFSEERKQAFERDIVERMIKNKTDFMVDYTNFIK